MKNKDFSEYTKQEIDRIKDCAPVIGDLFNQKCNRCGAKLSQFADVCDRCGSYDVVDKDFSFDDFVVIKPTQLKRGRKKK